VCSSRTPASFFWRSSCHRLGELLVFVIFCFPPASAVRWLSFSVSSRYSSSETAAVFFHLIQTSTILRASYKEITLAHTLPIPSWAGFFKHFPCAHALLLSPLPTQPSCARRSLRHFSFLAYSLPWQSCIISCSGSLSPLRAF